MQSTRSVTPEGIETAQATNVLGFYGLTRGLLPVLKQNAPARIVNVVSAGMLASQFKVPNHAQSLAPSSSSISPLLPLISSLPPSLPPL
jgi:NAD(P)-dependent dehydrogenase (short-subunit alcohol dehydrogenase family)